MTNNAEIRDVEIVSNLPAIRERSSVLLMPVMDLQTAMSRLSEFEAFCAHYLTESKDGGNDGGDYGIIPGTKKKALLKSGADKLCELYGLYDTYVIEKTVNWDTGLFDYELTCVLHSRRDDSAVGSGVGSCSSFESKYRWRDQKRACPQCGKATIIKGQEKYGGGWICWKKEGRSDGCGAKFAVNDKIITEQIQGRVENTDIIDIKNTVMKMAKKRSKIDAVIAVTRSSGIFTQDMDDVPMPPPKPEPTRTTEDMPLGSTEPSPQPPPQKGTAMVPATDADGTGEMKPDKQRKAAVKKAAVPADVEFPGCIDTGRKIAFARAWKDALHPSLQPVADQLRHDYEGRHGWVDADGNPTSAKIPMKDFEAIKKDAVAFAKQLPQDSRRNDTVTEIIDDDIPF